MPRVLINNIPVLSYGFSAREKYWTALSNHIIKKHGKKHFTDHDKVEKILLDGFQFLVDKFLKILITEKGLGFFLYVFWLHEQSIKLYVETLGGLKLHTIDENEFARYRRILKLILEQGCDIDLNWEKFPNPEDFLKMDNKIQELLYLGTWIYTLADYIAFQKMVTECHAIDFDNEDLLIIDWQHHYGETYNQLFPMLREDYEQGTFDESSIYELKSKINNCFKIDYDFAGGIIFEIKKHHSPQDPTLQTIQPYILPINLSKQFNISQEIAETFYEGLTLSRKNKLPIEEVILKPYSTQRYMFRPILIYNIGGEDRALVGQEKFAESMMVLATNALHWNAMLKEWLNNTCIRDFVNKKGREHDKILEDKIEQIIKDKNLLYSRNLKSLKQNSGNNIRIDNELAGEIDFLIANTQLKTVFVVEVKYNRAKYEAVGFRNDYTNFTKYYEKKLKKKVKWIKDNLRVLEEHFSILINLSNLNLSNFEVEGVFFINTPTFYMFNGYFKAITLKQIPEFIEGRYEYPQLFITKEKNNEEIIMMVQHPYFKKPITLTDKEI